MDERMFQGKYRIETTRLRGWDYANPGVYFITICTKGRIPWFGDIKNDRMHLSPLGRAAHECWLAIPSHFPHVTLDAHVIMPDHMHGMVVMGDRAAAHAMVETQNLASLRPPQPHKPESLYCTGHPNHFGPQSKNVASVIRGFKIGVTKFARSHHYDDFAWQPRFYDHIIRDPEAMTSVRSYILNNPAIWAQRPQGENDWNG
jgi:putative transposase